jgi:hypothetical protein
VLQHEVAQQFFDAVVVQADGLGLLSDEHFTVDGTLIEAAAKLESFRPKDGPPDQAPPADPGNPSVSFRGERRHHATHRSATDPEARLARKAKGCEARPSFMGYTLSLENRKSLLVDVALTRATGTAEREIAPTLVKEARQGRFHLRRLGADRSDDTAECVAEQRKRKVTRHVVQNTSRRRSVIDGRTTSAPGTPSANNQKARGRGLRLDEDHGRLPTDALPRAGADLPGCLPGATAYNLVRIARWWADAAINDTLARSSAARAGPTLRQQ